MGMFDYVNFNVACPECGANVGNFQSKDRECSMDTISPCEVFNFYAPCECGAWIEYTRPITHNNKTMSEKEVLAMGFKRSITPRMREK